MAKCIRVIGQGVPVRMSDADAFQVVERDHDGEYCSKKFWKDWFVSPAVGLPDKPRNIARLVGSKITETRTLARGNW